MSDKPTLSPAYIGAFTKAYVEHMLGSTYADPASDDIEFLGDRFGPQDIAPETMSHISDEATNFCFDHAEDLAQVASDRAGELLHSSREAMAIDFANHPGDPVCTPEVAARLDAAAKGLGYFELYLGDDGLLHHRTTPLPRTLN